MAEHPSRDDLVAFALGALDPEEAGRVNAHWPGCDSCERELEALAPAVGVLGESVEQLEPPPELRERVMAVVHQEAAQHGAPQGQRPPQTARPSLRRPALARFLLRPATALVAVAVIAAGVAGYLIADNGGGGGAQTVAVMPATTGIGGTLEVGDNTSTLKLQGMQQLTGSEVYQVWVAQGESLKPSSNFIPDSDGTATTGVDGHLTAGTKVMVTREPGPGRTTPTPPVLLSATVQ
jgi:Anti-sigma-K factor rskA, C-terminal